jgi:hypothetical protein
MTRCTRRRAQFGLQDGLMCGLDAPEARTGDFLPLARVGCQKLGAPAQTLAAMVRVAALGSSKRECFIAIDKLAVLACLPRRTVQAHLAKLDAEKVITPLGRTEGSAGRKRRTASYTIDRFWVHASATFFPLPRWAAAKLSTWGERCLFALIVSRTTMIAAITDAQDGASSVEERATIDQNEIRRLTGLSTRTIVAAKAALTRRRLIVIERGPSAKFADSMALNSGRLVTVGQGWRPNGHTNGVVQKLR